MLSDLGRFEQAISAYDNATKIDPQYSDAWNNKGVALKALNRNSEADEAFAKAG